jgi:hypothetical protein
MISTNREGAGVDLSGPFCGKPASARFFPCSTSPGETLDEPLSIIKVRDIPFQETDHSLNSVGAIFEGPFQNPLHLELDNHLGNDD